MKHDSGKVQLVKLQREIGKDSFGRPRHIILPNSVMSTIMEAERLRDDELARTGIVWEIVGAA